ncbi:MAG: hypothetical protein JO368_07205 [Acidimicrobiales bacterium]|nr:hypothetical protein [Acidimicrobiales bacterium]
MTGTETAGRSGLRVEVPGADPVIVAVITAAVDEVWPRPSAPASDDGASIPAWRFSGRWWSRPATVRRDRPLT